mmetsp:Transcript_57073/g.134336  ORF Transcript_57073/g.134336 Transcript_57073/m.134336 type:complete len:208 (-) Transcript_57073:659-1282(-)
MGESPITIDSRGQLFILEDPAKALDRNVVAVFSPRSSLTELSVDDRVWFRAEASLVFLFLLLVRRGGRVFMKSCFKAACSLSHGTVGTSIPSISHACCTRVRASCVVISMVNLGRMGGTRTRRNEWVIWPARELRSFDIPYTRSSVMNSLNRSRNIRLLGTLRRYAAKASLHLANVSDERNSLRFTLMNFFISATRVAGRLKLSRSL